MLPINWLIADLEIHIQRARRRSERWGSPRGRRVRNFKLQAERLEERTVLAAVLSTFAGQDAPELSPTADVAAVFDVPASPAAIKEDSLARDRDRNAAANQDAADGQELELEIDSFSDFAPDETVTATLTTGVTGDGDPLATDDSFAFHTLRETSEWETNPPPSVLATSPVSGGPKLAPGTDIELVFGVAMDVESFAPPNIVIEGETSGVHSYTHHYDPDSMTATLEPDTDFAFSERVTATVTTAVLGEDGQAVPEAYSFSFRTHDKWTEIDTPKVLATSPVQGGPMLAADTPIEIYFNTPMDAATLTADNITITGSSSGPHTGVFAYQTDELALLINPHTDFAYDEQVTVTVTTGVNDDDSDPAGFGVHVQLPDSSCDRYAPNHRRRNDYG